jgi:CheY-like chemotaxis protein
MSELLLEDLPFGSPEHEKIREILRAGKRGRHLVNQILAFSRQTAQEMMPLKMQPVITEVINLCRATIPAHIPITRFIQTDCPMVMADPTQIHQVAMNLITNAFHAVEDTGGTIDVRLEELVLTSQDVLKLDLVPGRYAGLSMSDTGCGMTSEVMDKIFDPYFTTKNKGKGKGLGLSVVHGHKGDIQVRSKIGKGTTFALYLPVIEHPDRDDPVEDKENLPTGDEHILLVDDEKPIVMLESQVLQRLGYKVTAFTDSRDAEAAFQANAAAFDLVITDMAMPHITGAKLAGIMIAVRPDIPIILCTGYSNRINKKTAKDIGIKYFFEKPVAMSELAHAVRNTLDEAMRKQDTR